MEEGIYQFGDIVACDDLVFAENLKPTPPVLLIFFPQSTLSIPLSDKERQRDGRPKRRAKRRLKMISVIHLEGKAAEAMERIDALSIADEAIDYRWMIDFLRACFLCGVGLGMRLATPPSILSALLNLGEEDVLPDVVPANLILFVRQEQKNGQYTYAVFFPGASLADQIDAEKETAPELAWLDVTTFPICADYLKILGADNLAALLLSIFKAGECHGFGQATAAFILLRHSSPTFL